jgi:hypothetical protein
MLEWKRQNGITHHFCQYGQHNAPLDQFTEETLGCCNDCLVTLRAETQRQHENHQVWLVWRDTPEGRLVRACADVVNEEKALDFADEWDLDFGNDYNRALRRVQRLTGLTGGDAYTYAHAHCNDAPPIR